MKPATYAAVLIAITAPAAAQVQPRTPPDHVPMAQMMQNMPQGGMGMMQPGMRGGMMGRFSAEDMSAFADAHIAALKAGLKLSADQERLWPPIEEAMRELSRLHLSRMQAMRQNRQTMMRDPIAGLRSMADAMSQGADGMRKLADAAAPLYETLDEAQKRRLRVLVRFGPRGMMGAGMMGGGMMGGPRMMMRGWSGGSDAGDGDEDDR